MTTTMPHPPLFRMSLLVRSRGKVLSTGATPNAIAAAAYSSAKCLVDRNSGKVHDYTRDESFVWGSYLLHPGPVPDWAKDLSSLWSAVERIEKRKDASIYRQFCLVLPYGMTEAQLTAMVLEFAEESLVGLGMSVQVDMRWQRLNREPGAPKNPHAYLRCLMRRVEATGLAQTKDRSWNDRRLIWKWRQEWEAIENKHLEMAGFTDRVDCRRRSVVDLPISLGKAAYHMERRGVRSGELLVAVARRAQWQLRSRGEALSFWDTRSQRTGR